MARVKEESRLGKMRHVPRFALSRIRHILSSSGGCGMKKVLQSWATLQKTSHATPIARRMHPPLFLSSYISSALSTMRRQPQGDEPLTGNDSNHERYQCRNSCSRQTSEEAGSWQHDLQSEQVSRDGQRDKRIAMDLSAVLKNHM